MHFKAPQLLQFFYIDLKFEMFNLNYSKRTVSNHMLQKKKQKKKITRFGFCNFVQQFITAYLAAVSTRARSSTLMKLS